jgi:hypothetical protein
MFFSHLSIVWASYLVINLHLTVVWKNHALEWFFNRYSVFCWCWPLAFTIAAVSLGQVQYESGATCLVSKEWANVLFFYPLTFIVGPACLVHVGTFVAIARSCWNHDADLTKGDMNEFRRPFADESLPRRPLMLQAVRVQWRALLLAFILCLTFVVFFSFYYFEASKLNAAVATPWARLWAGCILAGLGQDECALIAEPHVPSFALLAATDFVVSSAGFWLWIVFGARVSVLAEWKAWFIHITERRKNKDTSQGQEDSGKGDPYAAYLQ